MSATASREADPVESASGGGRWLAVSLVASSAILLAAAAALWRQRLWADEADFYWVATDWRRFAAMVPHPPAYVDLLRVLFGWFGPSVGTARVVGVVSAIATLWLIPPLARAIWGGSARTDRIAALAAILFAVSPLAIQNMMLIDIDNTVMCAALMGLLWLWMASEHWSRGRRVMVMTLAIAASAWIKMPPPALLMISIVLWGLFERRGRLALEAVLIAILGGLLFAANFNIHQAVTGFGFAQLESSFLKLTWLSDLKALLIRAPQSLGVLVMWLSVPQVVLWAFAGRDAFRSRPPQGARVRLVVIYTLVVTAFYAVVLPPAWGYPKYNATLVPVLALICASLLVDAAPALRRRAMGIGLAAAALTVLFHLLVVGDPLWKFYRVTFETAVGQLRARVLGTIAPFTVVGAWTVAVLVVAALVAWRMKIPRRAMVVVCLGGATFGALAATTMLQMRASYTTRYRYTSSDADLERVTARLRASLNSASTIAATKEVILYSGVPGYLIYTYLLETAPIDSMLSLLQGPRVDALAWTMKEERRAGRILGDPRIASLLAADFERELNESLNSLFGR